MTGQLAETVYHSSDGGATEDAANVWGSDVPYLQGKQDPYESAASIPDYQYTVTYTREELILGPPKQRLFHRRRDQCLCV